MKTIISVGYQIPGHSDCFEEFISKKSLLEADIILFSPNLYYQHMSWNHEGKPLYTQEASRKVQEDSSHWRREIGYCLDAGKTVFVFMKEYESFYIADKGHNYELFNNYKFLPLARLDIVPANGTKLKVVNPLFANFYNAFKDSIAYRAYIELKTADPIFKTPSGDMTLGAYIGNGKGHLILLPNIDYDWDEFTTYGNDAKVDGVKDRVWTEEAISWGKRLVSNLIDIDKALKSDKTRTPAPEWVSGSQYTLQPEIKILSKIESTEKQISKLKEAVNEMSKELNYITIIRQLLYEGGKNLENAVINALKIMGYEAEGYDDGTLELDQVIISPEGVRYIGECEGKDNSEIDISKFRQLADSIHEDLEKNETGTEAIGILFGNPFRLMAPEEREGYFTKKCVEAAKRRNYALIRTVDLFPICKYLIETKDKKFQKTCRLAIENGLGKIVSFPTIPKH